MELEHVRLCNLCGGSTFEVFATKRGAMTSEVFTIVRCECGLVFVTPRLTEAQNQALYDEEYFKGRGFDQSINYTDPVVEREHRALESAGIIAKIDALMPGRRARVLDVGCGTGGLLRALVDAGFENVTGLEFSSFAAQTARAASGAEVLEEDLMSATFGGHTFDVVNATEVVEHVRDPRRFFTEIARVLSPNGVFLYSTGNVEGLYARILGARWPYIHPEGHLHYFSPQTLTRYFRECGLDVLDVRTKPRSVQKALRRGDGDIAYSQLTFVGMSDRGMKGRVFRAAALAVVPPIRPWVATFIGRHTMPIAVKRT